MEQEICAHLIPIVETLCILVTCEDRGRGGGIMTSSTTVCAASIEVFIDTQQFQYMATLNNTLLIRECAIT